MSLPALGGCDDVRSKKLLCIIKREETVICVEAAVPWAATSTCLWLVAAVSMLVAMGNLIPVDYVPPGGEVVGAAILVLEILGMLPDIVTHYREHTVHHRAVLLASRDDLQFATPVEHEPRPS